MKTIKIVLLYFVLASTNILSAQQEQMYTHYDINSLAMNPAYAGTSRTFTGMMLRRNQWTDWPGAPVYNNLAIQGPINKDFAIGLNIQNGSIGNFQNAAPLSETHIGANLAYHKSLNKDWRLAVGLRVGLFNYNVQLSKIILDNPNDVSFQKDMTVTTPLAGFGLYLYNKNTFFALSSPRMVFIKEDIQNQVNLAHVSQIHHYVIAGTVIPLNSDLVIKPTTQIKLTNGVPSQIDLNVHAIFKEKMSLGAFYRSEADLGLMLSYQLTTSFKALYSYDYNLKRFDNSTMGSHEFGLVYSLPKFEKGRMPVPRFF